MSATTKRSARASDGALDYIDAACQFPENADLAVFANLVSMVMEEVRESRRRLEHAAALSLAFAREVARGDSDCGDAVRERARRVVAEVDGE